MEKRKYHNPKYPHIEFAFIEVIDTSLPGEEDYDGGLPGVTIRYGTDRAQFIIADSEEAFWSNRIFAPFAPAAFRDRISVTKSDIINDPLAQQGGEMQNPTCTWTFDEDDCTHHTSCGDAWQFTDGYAKDNGVKFCPFCGKPVLEKLPIPENSEISESGGGE